MICRNGLTMQDSATGVNSWVYNPEGCTEHITYEFREVHEKKCGYIKVPCGLPYGGGRTDCCPPCSSDSSSRCVWGGGVASF